jgi:flagellar basal-body rod protein FlgB
MSGLIDPTTSILEQALDGLTSRQSAISSNLANIDTPGYQAQTVDFETALRSEVQAMNWSGSSSDGSAAPSGAPSADVAMLTNDPRQYSSIATSFSSSGGPAAATDSTTNENLRNDGNTVDLETEMTALTETQIKYSAVSRLLTDKFSQLYDVLGGH